MGPVSRVAEATSVEVQWDKKYVLAFFLGGTGRDGTWKRPCAVFTRSFPRLPR